MRVLHIIWSFTVGGTECRLVDQFKHISPNVEPHLMIVNDHFDACLTNQLPSNVTAHFINRPISSKNPYYYLKFNFFVKKINPEVIIFHVANLVHLLFEKNKYPKILHLHNVHDDLTRHVDKYDGYIAISEAASEHIKKYRKKATPYVVYNGLCLSKISQRENYKLGETFKIIQLGRLKDSIKGQSFFLQVMKNITEHNHIEKWSLDFVGDGPSRSTLERLSVELGLENNVNFLGQKPVDFVYENLKDYNLLVLPSFSEGLGNAVIEGMAAKIPVLVSNLPGPMEVIKSGEYGKYFEAGNSNDCVKKVTEIYKDYKNGQVENKTNVTYKYAKDMFDISNMVINVENLYRDFLSIGKDNRQ